jgi:hypothetical protein
VVGFTDAKNFPTNDATGPAVQALPGNSGDVVPDPLDIDTFVAKYSSSPGQPDVPSKAYSTYIGGNGWDVPKGITVTPAGDAYIVGLTVSQAAPVPTVPSVANPDVPEVFVTKLAAPPAPTAPAVLNFAVSAGAPAGGGGVLGASIGPNGALFVAGANGDGLSLTILNVKIDVRPGSKKNKINTRSKTVSVAILSSKVFDASKDMDLATLTFGHSGTEASLVKCEKKSRKDDRDNDKDDRNKNSRDKKVKFTDLVCRFNVKKANFQAGDTSAILQAKLVAGGNVVGSDAIMVIVPRPKPHEHEDQWGHKMDKEDEDDDLD